jgi:SsrA-binding protein
MNIANNKRGYYEYHIINEYDCGIILLGNEVKSIRDGNINFSDSFIYLNKGEVWLRNFKISPYKMAHPSSKHEENRDKKLLLNKKEITKISKSLEVAGITCIPLKVFINNNRIKIKIGVAKGKKLWDKKESIKKRDIERELRREGY